MISISDSNSFENVISKMETSNNNIKEILEKVNVTTSKVDDTDIWTGLAQKEFTNKYNELKSNYDDVNNSLTENVKFLKEIIDKYKTAEDQANRSIDNNDIKLDVNS